MTAAVVDVETRQAATSKRVFGEGLIGRFAMFAGVSENSRITYTKSLRQMFRYFAANGVVNPAREHLIVWIKAMAGEKLNNEDNAPRLMIDCRVKDKAGEPNKFFCEVHYDGEVAADGDVYKVIAEKNGSLVTFMKGNEVIGHNKSASTIQLYTAAAKVFFRWTAQDGHYPNIADHLKTGIKLNNNHKRDALSVKNCKKLVASVKGNTVKDLRDRAILSVMVTAGLRTIEVVRANAADFEFEDDKVFLQIQGKGHSDADEKILLSKQTYRAIDAYLKARGAKRVKGEPLFTSTSNRNKNGRLDTQAIRKMVKKNLRGIGLDSPRLSAHSLRHSVATNLIEAQVALPKVQMVMRHKSLSTTMIYQHVYERATNDGEQILADIIFKE